MHEHLDRQAMYFFEMVIKSLKLLKCETLLKDYAALNFGDDLLGAVPDLISNRPGIHRGNCSMRCSFELTGANWCISFKRLFGVEWALSIPMLHGSH